MNNLIKFYRIQLILSVSLAVVIISQVYKNGTLDLILITLGVLLGTFFLDLDYFIHAYFLDPNSNFSHKLKDYVKNKNIVEALNYTIFHSNEIKNKTHFFSSETNKDMAYKEGIKNLELKLKILFSMLYNK